MYFYLLSFKSKSGHFLHSLQLSYQVHVFLYYTFVLLLPCQDLQNSIYTYQHWTMNWTEEQNGGHPPSTTMSCSSTLFSGSGPVGLPPVPWTEKNWKFAIFQPTRRSFLQRRPGWMDNLLGSPLLVKVTATG